jgi:uncharacterized protein YraI
MYSTHFRSHPLPRFRLLMSIVVVLLLGIVFQPAAAQSGSVWTGEYYNNAYLSGDPVLTRQDGVIAFNWGVSSPAPEVKTDNFSIRWATDPYFEAGTYRFYILADDQVALRVNFPYQPQIDTINNPSVGQILSADVTLKAGVHHVQVDYREVTGNAYIYVTWDNLATNPTGPDFPVPQSPLPVGGIWTAQYYGNPNLAGTPARISSESTPSHSWGLGSPSTNILSDNFSARWTSVQTLNTGNYQIRVHVDDGVRVYIDGVVLIDEWHPAVDVTYTTDVYLVSGQHRVQVDYYEASGIAFIDYNLIPLTPNIPPVVNSPATTTGTVVTALRLNVRRGPNTNTGVLVKINLKEIYPVIGRNADSSWWQINVNGTVGWVYWRFFDVNNPQLVPVVTSATGESLDQLPATGYYALALATVNVRSDPNSAGAILGQVARGNRIAVVGRNATNTWWQVNYGQITGWVSSRYAQLQGNVLLANIPVTG